MKSSTRNITISIIVAIMLILIIFRKRALTNSYKYFGADGKNPNDFNDYADLQGRKAEISFGGAKETADLKPTYEGTGSMEIYLNLQNLSAQTQNVTLFDTTNKYDQQAINGTTFSYDLTSELAQSVIFGNESIVVIALSATSNGYQTYTYTSGTPITTITQVVNGLNTLGLGTWTNPIGNTVQLITSTYFLSNLSITNIFTANAASATTYSLTGSLIYSDGFQTNGVGTVTQIPTSNAFWINAASNLTDGAMNRNAVWNDASIPFLEYIGTDISVYMPNAGTVYIGLGFDNVGRFWVNGNLILDMDINAMRASILSQYPIYSYVSAPKIPFYFWHIFPIQLPAGYSSIFVQNDNSSLQGAMAIEIYNNTAAQIATATSYANLNVLFRSANIVGQNSLY